MALSFKARQQKVWLDEHMGDAPFVLVYRARHSRSGGRTGNNSTLHRGSCSALLTANGAFRAQTPEQAAASLTLAVAACGRCNPQEGTS